MIINGSYFVGDIYLPQVGSGASAIANNNDLLERYIKEYEPKILKKGLGSRLYNELEGNLNSDGSLKESAEQKWNDLLNGKEYTKNDITYYWRGIVDDHGSYKKSFIAYYVFYWYIKKNNTALTTLGAVKPQAENAEAVSPVQVLTDAWREFHEWYSGSNSSTSANAYYHKGFYVEDWFGGNDNSKEVSLYTFLSDNKDDYPNWNFTNVENKTSWGL